VIVIAISHWTHCGGISEIVYLHVVAPKYITTKCTMSDIMEFMNLKDWKKYVFFTYPPHSPEKLTQMQENVLKPNIC